MILYALIRWWKDNMETKDGYELYCDSAYYDMWCVRNINDKRFQSPTSFHFIHKADAEEFKRLIEIAQ